MTAAAAALTATAAAQTAAAAAGVASAAPAASGAAGSLNLGLVGQSSPVLWVRPPVGQAGGGAVGLRVQWGSQLYVDGDIDGW